MCATLSGYNWILCVRFICS